MKDGVRLMTGRDVDVISWGSVCVPEAYTSSGNFCDESLVLFVRL